MGAARAVPAALYCLQAGGVPLAARSHNVEQIFSRAKLLSDPNMDPHRLAILVMVAVNKKAYKPSVEAIKDMYYELFRGKPGADDVEELPNTAPAPAPARAPAPAPVATPAPA